MLGEKKARHILLGPLGKYSPKSTTIDVSNSDPEGRKH